MAGKNTILHDLLERNPPAKHAELLPFINGASPKVLNCQNKWGWTPLRLCLRPEVGGDEASALIVHSLLEAGANQFLFALKGKLAPVHEAARLSYAHCLRELYSQDARCISFPMEVGLTALHYAVQSKQMACIDFLLEKGVEVDFKCQQGNTAAHYAGAIGERDIMDYLISQGADPLSRNAHGFSPFGKLFGDIISKKRGLYNAQAAHENERAQSIFPEMSLDECQKLLDEMSEQRPEKWSDKAHIFHQVSHQHSQAQWELGE